MRLPANTPVPCTESRVPGLVVPMPNLPVVLAIVRYVVVPALRLLITPMLRLPMVVEANQWVIFEGSLGESVIMNWGEEVEMIERVA